MADEIIIKYKVEVDGLKADFKTVQTEMKAIEKQGVDSADKTTAAFTKTEGATKSLRTQLQALKEQLGRATDPKEIERLAKAAGHLTNQINSATAAAHAFANESKATTAKNLFGQIQHDLANLNFKEAADKAKLFAGVMSSMSFKEVIGGIKSFGSALSSIGSALLTNPFTLIVAGIAAVAYVAYDLGKAFVEMGKQSISVTEALKSASEALAGYNDRMLESQIRIKELIGVYSKGQAEIKRSEVKNNKEIKDAKKQYYEDLKKLAEENNINLADTGDKFKLATLQGNALDQAKALMAIHKFNRDKELLDKSFNEKMKGMTSAQKQAILAIQIDENIQKGAASKAAIDKMLKDANDANKKATDDAIREAERLSKLLRDLRTGNILDDQKREQEILKNKYDDDSKAEKGHTAVLLEYHEKYLRDKEAIDIKYRQKEMDATMKQADRQIASDKGRIDAQIKLDNELDASIMDNLTNQMNEIFAANDKKEVDAKITEEQIQAIQQASFQFISSMISSIAEIQNNRDQQNLQNIEDGHNKEVESLDDQLKRKEITQIQYDQRKKQADEKQRAQERKIKQEAWERNKQVATLQSIINTAVAITSAMKEEYPLNIVLAAIAAATGAAQLAVIASQPTPKFAKGVVGLKGKGTGTSDEIPAMLSKGESVIIAEESAKYNGLLNAMNKKQTGKFIEEFYITPALKAQKQKFDSERSKSFADSLVNSLALNNRFYDGNLLDSLKQSRKNDKEIAMFLAKELKGNGYNPRNW